MSCVRRSAGPTNTSWSVAGSSCALHCTSMQKREFCYARSYSPREMATKILRLSFEFAITSPDLAAASATTKASDRDLASASASSSTLSELERAFLIEQGRAEPPQESKPGVPESLDVSLTCSVPRIRSSRLRYAGDFLFLRALGLFLSFSFSLLYAQHTYARTRWRQDLRPDRTLALSRSLEPQRLLPSPSPPHYKPSTPRRSLGHRRIPSVFDFACWIDARSRISTSFIRSFVRVVALCCTLVK